jgi:two-component system response regulator
LSDRFQRSRVPALPTVLFADASEDYRSMARDALLEGRNVTDMRTVGDGNALLAYLLRAGATDGAVTPIPSLIVVDADLPGTPPGKEAVAALKTDPKVKRIPVVVLGASDDPADTASWYEVGANTYIVKPVTFLALVRLMKVFTAYWLETAELPPDQAA